MKALHNLVEFQEVKNLTGFEEIIERIFNFLN